MRPHVVADNLEQISFDVSYLCVVEQTSTGFSAFFPDIPGVIATSDNYNKLIQLLRDALYLYLDDLSESNEAPPTSETKEFYDEDLNDYQTVLIYPSKPEHVSEVVDQLISNSGLSYAELARRIDVPRSVISRLTSPIYRGHSMESLRKVAHALGYEVEVTFKKAD